MWVGNQVLPMSTDVSTSYNNYKLQVYRYKLHYHYHRTVYRFQLSLHIYAPFRIRVVGSPRIQTKTGDGDLD